MDVHGAIDNYGDAAHRRIADVDRGAEGVMKSVEQPEEGRDVKSASQTVLGSNELRGGSFATSKAEITLARVPYVPADPPFAGEVAAQAPPGRRDHAARLAAASVLDAPASMHESVPPPSNMQWALWLWAGVMLGIIGLAGFVALRNQADAGHERARATLSSPTSQSGERAPVATAAAKSVVTAVAPPTPSAAATPAATRGRRSAAPDPVAVAPAKVAAARGVETAADEDSAEESARTRKGVRRAEAGTGAVSVKAVVEGATSELTKARVVDLPVEPAKPTDLTSAPVIPGNPYDSEDQVANGTP